jgi:predicted NAD-dependent protein-ADP-ribosyltransferase YbiA (DUF1768 family)
MAIHFYSKSDTYREFSNFAPFGIDLDGAWWATVEHYYQAPEVYRSHPAKIHPESPKASDRKESCRQEQSHDTTGLGSGEG